MPDVPMLFASDGDQRERLFHGCNLTAQHVVVESYIHQNTYEHHAYRQAHHLRIANTK